MKFLNLAFEDKVDFKWNNSYFKEFITNQFYKMDIDHIKERINYFKKGAIDDSDHYFNKFIVNDILDVGNIDYIINDEDWYLYWMELAKDLKEVMDTLINEYYNQRDKNEDTETSNIVYDFLLECVSIKKVIDSRLRECKSYNELEVKEWIGIDIQDQSLFATYIPILGNDKDKSLFINELHKLLFQKRFITVQINEFSSHFRSNPGEIKKIQWHGTEIRIAALFNLMIDNGIMDRSYQDKKALLIIEHFINRFGKEYRNKQLGVVLSKASSKDFDHLFKDISKIIAELVKIN